MPFYTFKCKSCSREEDIQQTMDAPIPKCERCISASCGTFSPEMERVWKPAGKPQFKGSGFYETDYKGNVRESNYQGGNPELDKALNRADKVAEAIVNDPSHPSQKGKK